MAELPEHILIARAQQGDDEAIAGLYRTYVRPITRYIAYRVSDEAVVEDLTAEVFLRMVEGLPQYRVTGAPFEAWLYRIAAARVADFYRERQRHTEQELTDILGDGRTPLELGLQQREELEELRAALAQLSEEHQTILILRFVERKSHDEVARILNNSVRAIATAQHRALKKLAGLLGTDKAGRHYIRGDSE
jgi:RNA polymerase sigma-70 factor (ECF subfamily)